MKLSELAPSDPHEPCGVTGFRPIKAPGGNAISSVAHRPQPGALDQEKATSTLTGIGCRFVAVPLKDTGVPNVPPDELRAATDPLKEPEATPSKSASTVKFPFESGDGNVDAWVTTFCVVPAESVTDVMMSEATAPDAMATRDMEMMMRTCWDIDSPVGVVGGLKKAYRRV
jgi:hypothetical protein